MNKLILPITSAAAAFLLSTPNIAQATNQDIRINELAAQVHALYTRTSVLKQKLHKLEAKHGSHHVKSHKHRTSPPFPHFVTITTSPFMGKQTSFAPSDLLYQVSSMNEDLRLLKIKRDFINALSKHGDTISRPIVQISGGVEGQAYSTGGFGTKATDSIALSGAGLEVNALASNWASAFMSFNYDGSPISSGNRAPNGKIYLKRGFVTLGNLNTSPIYGSIGLMYVPFGRYSSGMLSTPLTLSMGRIRSETALLGLSLDNGIYGSVYGFTGSQTSQGTEVFFKQGGANLGVKRAINKNMSYSMGAGWVSNIADAEGQQNNGLGTTSGTFGGFAVFQPGSTVSNNSIVHRVGGYDVHGKFACHDLTFIAEYLSAASPYYAADMQFNSKGAQPSAVHAEVDYNLPFGKKYSASIGVSYGETWEALALNLPKNSYATFFQTSLLKDTIESIEYRHDVDYAATDTATGRGATTNITGTGKNRNSVIMQVGVYF